MVARHRRGVAFAGRRGGEIKPDLDVDCVADFLLAALNVDLYLFQRRELGMDRERIVASLSRLLDGLRAAG